MAINQCGFIRDKKLTIKTCLTLLIRLMLELMPLTKSELLKHDQRSHRQLLSKLGLLYIHFGDTNYAKN